jgi:DNA helicase-2/ATP-dependent DNA helicase PcrA
VSELSLNPEQRVAVEHRGGPLLVIAGAGSGKTRVLTARVASLVAEGVPADKILAFTFTNRAAREMRERIARAVGEDGSRLWVGTFHATGVRILRREARTLARRWPGFPVNFSIHDRDDTESVLKSVMKEMELSESSFRPGEVLNRISDAKNALVSPAEMERLAVSPWERRIAECYGRYQTALRRQGALDFDDLIAEPVRMLLEDPEAGQRWAERFAHVLVDEYQDTNHAQFRMVKALAGAHGNLFVVGDDDQSIYGWRGADLANVLEFEQAFPGATVVRLEQNYRSTANILRAANVVIANNRSRKGKTLWCEREDGPRLRFVLSPDEADEARRIADALAERLRRGGRLEDCAVLYRTNAQSRALETELRHRGFPYEVVGGIAFYQRREVKDVIAYLRLVVNPSDAVAFWRVWNTPRRGLGDAVQGLVQQRVVAGAANPIEGLRELVRDGVLSRAAHTGATAFLAVLDRAVARIAEPVDQVIRQVLEESGYLAVFDKLPEHEREERRANLEELCAGAEAFAQAGADPTLTGFLAEAALLTDLDRLEGNDDRVLLLTMHNAKGLEFPLVVVAGLEEGLLPHASSQDDPAELEEERRLFYVALTRARDQVLLTAAAFRRRWDGASGGQVSRFVDEIPEDLLDREQPPAPAWSYSGSSGGWDDEPGTRRPAGATRRRAGPAHSRGSASGDVAPAYRTRSAHAHLVGREVYHDVFGRGMVMGVEGEGDSVKFAVKFGNQIKKVLGRFLTGAEGGE